MMPFRLIFLAILMLLFVTFIGFNIENRCDVSFAVYTLDDVPVVLTILASFALGLVAALPFARKSRKARAAAVPAAPKKKKGRKAEETPESALDEGMPKQGAGKP